MHAVQDSSVEFVWDPKLCNIIRKLNLLFFAGKETKLCKQNYFFERAKIKLRDLLLEGKQNQALRLQKTELLLFPSLFKKHVIALRLQQKRDETVDFNNETMEILCPLMSTYFSNHVQFCLHKHMPSTTLITHQYNIRGTSTTRPGPAPSNYIHINCTDQ